MDISSISLWSLARDFSIWTNLLFKLSIVLSASVRRAWSFNLDNSNSSALATASVSYFWRHNEASASAFLVCLLTSSRAADSSSSCCFKPSTSCSRFLNFPSRRPLSLASLSATCLTSSSPDWRDCLTFWSKWTLLLMSPAILRRSAFSAASLRLWLSKSPNVMLASSTFLLRSLSWDNRFLFDFSEEALAREISSVAALASAISCWILTLSFSILDFIFESWSICSDISWIASWCFFFKEFKIDSCWMLISSRSLRSFWTSASLFLLSSIWAWVAPPASFRRSPSSSSSLARSERCLSALALAWRSASNSSSNSSTRPWNSLICFCTFATKDCSSSSLALRAAMSFSLRAIMFSCSFLLLSRSATDSWASLSSPSAFLLCLSVSALWRFSLLTESSSSSRVCSSFDLIEFRWLTLSSAAWRSSAALDWFSEMDFFSLLSLLMTSSWAATSSLRERILWSLLVFSCSSFWRASSRSSMSFLMIPISPSILFLSAVSSCLDCSSWASLFCASTSCISMSALRAAALACLSW